ncbi:MAG: aminotransferase class III-fold pyridoxal phosphate-dependent enzyme, partial [Pseudomonadota bacterium]
NGFPIGAVVAKRHVAESMAGKFCFHTYGASPTACAAGRAVLQVMQEEQLQANAKRVGALLLERLVDLKRRYPVIGDVRGKGLMLAIELVKDQKTREPDPDSVATVFELARDHDLILSKSGPHKSVLRFVPPLCLSVEDVDKIADGLDASFAALSA